MVLLCSTMSISLPLNPVTSAVVCFRPPPQMPVLSAARFSGIPFATKTHLLRLCSASSGNAGSSGFDGSSVEKQGSNGKDDNSQAVSSNEILVRLKRYGISGILSYGLLNTAYYLTTFLVVWFYVAPAPAKMGYLAAAERFLKVMAMVWAGSQVTKLMRAGGALALAPFVDRGLSWFTIKMGFESQGKAFMAIAGLCFGLAFLMFVIVTLLWA
ncbi:uncharacterized protein LOC131022506 isoform X1 [Salvia miltiorrhiza]|uniref:uncharacterized protein LOC131022506 isoform X1 n=1 Tax=Salvia miltiorrhiza TaxID=226208 RepID=UPI0025AC511A|nr:uncharacterized protein LOC131022506 isoform X1 [Salvia miltiorrhiza]